MSKINLSAIPNQEEMGADQIIDYMVENDHDTLVNDFGSGIEYDISEIKESFLYIKVISVISDKELV